MPLTEMETRICGIVVQRLLRQHESTPRTELLRTFKTALFDPLQRLTNRYVLSAANQMAGSEAYLPRAVAFHYCGDGEALAVARRSTEIALRVVRNLFDVQLETKREESFTFEDAATEAMQISPTVNADMVWLGLYLAQEFSVFGTRQMDTKQIGIVSFRPIEHIYSVTETANIWDKHVQEDIKGVENDWKPARTDVAEYAAESDDNGMEFDYSFSSAVQQQSSRKVFIVHGRSDVALRKVSEFLKSLDLEVVILYRQPNQGQTVIEKFEKHSDVGFAVVLLTPDDEGAPVNEPTKKQKRARQNVILELGYFIARLGRERVCPLRVGEVELPSDIHGIVWVPYDNAGDWRVKLAEEINLSGIKVDMGRAAARPRIRGGKIRTGL
jgi:predicted nucleotide-binding protein